MKQVSQQLKLKKGRKVNGSLKQNSNLLHISIRGMPVAKASLTLPYSECFASHSISIFRFDCFIRENVFLHILLTNFQKLSAVSNAYTVIIAH